MTTLFVTYPGDASTRFDRDYYVRVHIPLVLETWGPHGLSSCVAFFPAGEGGPTIAVAVCEFRDEAAAQWRTLSSPRRSILGRMQVPRLGSAAASEASRTRGAPRPVRGPRPAARKRSLGERGHARASLAGPSHGARFAKRVNRRGGSTPIGAEVKS